MTLNAELVENFHAIFRQRQSGSLIVTGKDITVRFLFQDGEVMAMDLGQDKELLLVDKLREYHRLDQTQHALVLATRERVQGNVSDIVSQLQLASDDEIGQTTRAMVEDVLCGVFGGAVSKLRFDPGQQVASYNFDRTAVRLRIAVEVLLKTVEARVSEIDEVAKAVGGNEATYAFAEGAEGAGALSDFEKHVLNFVDGHSTIDDMARACRDSSGNLARILYQLTKKGVIRRLAPRNKGTASGANPVIPGPPSGPQPTSGAPQSPQSPGLPPRPEAPTVRDMPPMAPEPAPSRMWLWILIAVVVIVLLGLWLLISSRNQQDQALEKQHIAIMDQVRQKDWVQAETAIAELKGALPDDVDYQRKVKAIDDEVSKAMQIEIDGIKKAIAAGNFAGARRALVRLPQDLDAVKDLTKFIADREDDYKTQVNALVQQVDQLLSADTTEAVTKALAAIQAAGPMGKEQAVQFEVAHWASKHTAYAQSQTNPLADRVASVDLASMVLTAADDRQKLDQIRSGIDQDRKNLKAVIAQLQALVAQGDYKTARQTYKDSHLRDAAEGTPELVQQVKAINEAIANLETANSAYRTKVLEAITKGSDDDLANVAKQGEGNLAAHSGQADTQVLIDAIHDLQGMLKDPPTQTIDEIRKYVNSKAMDSTLSDAFSARAQLLQQTQDEAEIELQRIMDKLHADPTNWPACEADLNALIANPRYAGTAARERAIKERDEGRAQQVATEANRELLEKAMEAGDPTEVDRLCRLLGYKYPPLWIGSTPMGAEIYQNGQRLGVTPLAVEVQAADRDSYAIELRAPGFVPRTLTAKGAVGGWRLLVPMERATVCPPVDLGQGVTSRPTALKDKVWVANRAQGFLVGKDGAVQPVAFESGGSAPLNEPVYAPVVASDDGLYQATRENLAIHIDSKGGGITREPLGGATDYALTIFTSPLLIDRRFIIIASNDGVARGIDALHPTSRWSGPQGAPFAGAPVQVNDAVLFAHRDGALEALQANDGHAVPNGTAAIGGALIATWPQVNAAGQATGIAGCTADSLWSWTGTGDIQRQALPQTAVAATAGAFVGTNGTDNQVVWQQVGPNWNQVGRTGGKVNPDCPPLVWNGEVVVVVTKNDGSATTSTATIFGDHGFSVSQPSEFLPPVIVGGNLVLVTQAGKVLIYSP
jgi:hypothetical protein